MKKKKATYSEVTIDSFKAGVYPQGTFQQKELGEITETYDPKVYEAPILIGHLSDYKGETKVPAFGWIGKVNLVGDHLHLVASQFSEELKKWYKDGLYKKVSAAFFDPSDPSNPTPGKWHLHHLAFLGAKAPQVKGLEGIAFCELPVMLQQSQEFGEMETELTEFGDIITSVAEVADAGIEDTVKSMSESCANFIDKIEAALTENVDGATKKSRISLAVFDLNSELCCIKDSHFNFEDKLSGIGTEKELSEKKSWLIELAEKITNKNKRKEQDQMEKEQEVKYQQEIAELKAKNKEFADKEIAAKEQKDIADKKYAEDALLVKVQQFCTENKLDTKKHKELNIEGILFAAAKVQSEVEFAGADSKVEKKPLLEVLQTAMKAFQLPQPIKGNMDKEFAEAETKGQDKRSELVQKVDKYIETHSAEFSKLSTEQARAKVITLEANGKLKLN
jgi:hypothetical protein